MEINENMEHNTVEDNDPILPEGWTDKDDIFSDNWAGATTAEEDDFFADAEPSFEDMDDEPTDADPTTDPAQKAAPVTAEEEPAGAEPPTTEEQEPTQEPTSNKLRFKARIDHEDVDAEIDESDLPAIYQKAATLDRYQQKLDKVNPVMARMERMAKANGFETVEAMLDAQETFERESAVERLVKEGAPKEIAEHYVNSKYGQAADNGAKETKPTEPAAEPAQTHEPAARDFGAEIRELWELRPELKGKTLPSEVAAAAAKGQRLALAYFAHEVKQARTEAENSRKENEILKQNAAAAAKAPVKGVAGGGPTDSKPKDPFLDGFDSDYK